MISTVRRGARWSLTFLAALCVPFAIRGSALAILALLILIPLLFVLWWPSHQRTTDDRHCGVCGYPFPTSQRRCPECGSVD